MKTSAAFLLASCLLLGTLPALAQQPAPACNRA
jgi:hypothetical protein